MNVCIFGSGLVSITLAKALVNQGIFVDFISNPKINSTNKSRTIGISKTNIDFFNENILDIKNLLWNIDEIEIYSDNLKKEKILNFQNKNLFSMIKNDELYAKLIQSLKKNKFFKFKKNESLLPTDYNLIINCDSNNLYSKKYFYRKIKKKYHGYAHTTIIDHKKILKNNTATQVFTNKGPLAFLPISSFKTSIVYSARGSKDVDLAAIVQKYNNKYSITNTSEKSVFELSSMNLRNYYYKNILAFGELLHKIHPLAGQGFNMSIRDIRFLLGLIKIRLNCGLELDNSICKEFEKKTRHKNYLFSSGVDFIYEFFNLESRIKNPILSKSVQFIGKNRYANKFFSKLADDGIVI